MMPKLATLEFYRGSLQFSAGHFTLFSATERERLHGHNYYLHASVTAEIDEPGITFNYEIFRTRLQHLCQQLHLFFLLPQHSPYLQITLQAQNYEIIFNQEKIVLPKNDVLILPLANITLEELSQWFVDQIRQDVLFIEKHHIHAITIKCFNGTEHSASAHWQDV